MTDLNYEMICKEVSNRFWGSNQELVDWLREADYEVLEDFGEYIVIDEGNGTEWLLYIARANNTVWVAYVKEGN